jgi:uncharacterized membrane protein
MSKHKPSKKHHSLHQEKQEKFLHPKPRSFPRPLVGAAIGLIVILVIVAVYVTNSLSGNRNASQPIIPASGQDIQIPLAELNDGQAKFYRYELSKGREIEFFVIRSSDGVYRAAFNSCDVCFQTRQGYRQEGDNMVCNKCSQRFPSQYINELKGGCNPVPLTRTVQGDVLVYRFSET